MTYLIDTNVLVYARGDESEPSKTSVARELVTRLALSGEGLLSSHVLTEAFDVLARGSAARDGREAAARHVALLAEAFGVEPIDASMVLMASAMSARTTMRVFDALLWAAAHSAGADTVLTEDVPNPASIGGITFVDPFAEGFALEA